MNRNRYRNRYQIGTSRYLLGIGPGPAQLTNRVWRASFSIACELRRTLAPTSREARILSARVRS